MTGGLNGGNGFDFLELDFSGLFEGEAASRVQLVLYDNSFAGTREEIVVGDRQFNIGITNFEQFHIIGSGGNDLIWTHRDFDADDEVHGGAGDDDLRTFGGDDVVTGGDGNDFIDTGDGDDHITGGAGDDNLRAGAGADTFVITLGAERDFISGFSVGEDKIDVSAFDTATAISAIESYKSGTTDVVQLADNAFVEFSSAFDRSTLKLSNFIFSEPVEDEDIVPVGRSLSELLQASDYGSITSHLALFSKAAYGNEGNLLQLQNQGWTLYSEDEAEHFFSTSRLTDLTPLEGLPNTELDGYVIRAGNTSLVLGRTDDALIISFTGTNENRDVFEWFQQDRHFDKLLPVLIQILDLVEQDGSISDLYFTGHSLGAAMAEISFTLLGDAVEAINPDVAVHMHTFASPGYNANFFDEATDIALSALQSALVGGAVAGPGGFVSGALRGALAGVTELTVSAFLDEIRERTVNSELGFDSNALTAWVQFDIINAAAIFGDNAGRPFEIKVVDPTSVAEASREIVLEAVADAAFAIASFYLGPWVRVGKEPIKDALGELANLIENISNSVSYHSQDLYADTFLEIDAAISANTDLKTYLSSLYDYAGGELFFGYDGAVVVGENDSSFLLGSDSRWDIGSAVSGENYVDFATVSASFIDVSKRLILLGPRLNRLYDWRRCWRTVPRAWRFRSFHAYVYVCRHR